MVTKVSRHLKSWIDNSKLRLKYLKMVWPSEEELQFMSKLISGCVSLELIVLGVGCSEEYVETMLEFLGAAVGENESLKVLNITIVMAHEMTAEIKEKIGVAITMLSGVKWITINSGSSEWHWGFNQVSKDVISLSYNASYGQRLGTPQINAIGECFPSIKELLVGEFMPDINWRDIFGKSLFTNLETFGLTIRTRRDCENFTNTISQLTNVKRLEINVYLHYLSCSTVDQAITYSDDIIRAIDNKVCNINTVVFDFHTCVLYVRTNQHQVIDVLRNYVPQRITRLIYNKKIIRPCFLLDSFFPIFEQQCD